MNYDKCVVWFTEFYPLITKTSELSVVNKKSVTHLIPFSSAMELRNTDLIYNMVTKLYTLASGVILNSVHFFYNQTAESMASFYRYGPENVQYVFYKAVEGAKVVIAAGVNIVYLVLFGLTLYFVSEVGPGLVETNNKRRKLN